MILFLPVSWISKENSTLVYLVCWPMCTVTCGDTTCRLMWTSKWSLVSWQKKPKWTEQLKKKTCARFSTTHQHVKHNRMARWHKQNNGVIYHPVTLFFGCFSANSSDQPTEGIPPNGGDCKGIPPKVPEAFRFWNLVIFPEIQFAELAPKRWVAFKKMGTGGRGFPVVWQFGIDILLSFSSLCHGFSCLSFDEALGKVQELDDMKNGEGFFWRGKIHWFLSKLNVLFVLFGLNWWNK